MAGFVKILALAIVMGFLLAPTAAKAQPLTNYATLEAALGGNAADQDQLMTDLGLSSCCGSYPYDTGTIMNAILVQFGGIVNADNLLNEAQCGVALSCVGVPTPLTAPELALQSTAVTTIGGLFNNCGACTDPNWPGGPTVSIGGNFFETYIATEDANDYGYGIPTCNTNVLFQYTGPLYPPNCYDLNGTLLPNSLSTNFSYILGGTGNQATQLIVAGLCSGNADAIAELNNLFYDPFNGYPSGGGADAANFLTAMETGMGGGPPATLAAACAALNGALAGNAIDNAQINFTIATILYASNSLTPNTYDALGTDWLMTVPVTPTGLTGSPLPIILLSPPPYPPTPPGPVPAPPPLPPAPPAPPAPPMPPTPPTPPVPPVPPTPPAPPAPPPGPVPTPAPVPPVTGQAGPTDPGGPTNDCSDSGADLTSTFGVNPCSLSEDMLTMGKDPNYWYTDNNPAASDVTTGTTDEAGQQFVQHVNNWFDNEYLPALKNMTAQLSASVIDQTRQMGSVIDSHNLSKNGKTLQDMQLDAHKRVQPNEHSCVAATSVPAQTTTLAVANALESAFKYDGLARSGGGNGLMTAGTGNPSASNLNSVNDQGQRWNDYCKYFLDVNANGGNGANACANPTTAPASGTGLANGDIDVEGVLFQDSIDLSQTPQYHSVETLLQNLIDPVTMDPIVAIDSPMGHEAILERQHVKAVRSLAYDVVGSIISRRAAIPGTNVGTHIQDIRKRASIDPCRYAGGTCPSGTNPPANPSYNEIMLALTKERFEDPDYYARMGNDIGAIKQEQTSVNAYITITMQDVYKLQEQVNALLAARAAMKLEKEPVTRGTSNKPIR